MMEENIRRFGEYRALFFEGRGFTNQQPHAANPPEVPQVYGACRLTR
ncbi:MAG: hypothetical protein ACP5JJ_16030 [Anaerolineae bacterium]